MEMVLACLDLVSSYRHPKAFSSSQRRPGPACASCHAACGFPAHCLSHSCLRWRERRGDTDDDTAFSPSASVSAPGEGQDLDSSAYDAVRCCPLNPDHKALRIKTLKP